MGNYINGQSVDEIDLYQGQISVAGDFPTSGQVDVGYWYTIAADVTDNDATKTNTGQSFNQNDDIFWNGTNWTILGNEGFSHVQNTDTKLDEGGANEVTASNTLSSITKTNWMGSTYDIGNASGDISLTVANGQNQIATINGNIDTIDADLDASYDHVLLSLYDAGSYTVASYRKSFAITGLDQGAKKFYIAGDQTPYIPARNFLEDVSGSTGNDGAYTVTDVTYNDAELRTEITVSEAIPDATVDGNFKIRIKWAGATALTWTASGWDNFLLHTDDDGVTFMAQGKADIG